MQQQQQIVKKYIIICCYDDTQQWEWRCAESFEKTVPVWGSEGTIFPFPPVTGEDLC